MASSNRARTGSRVLDGQAVVATYGRWLGRQPLAVRTRAAYLGQVEVFVGWLVDGGHGEQVLRDASVRDRAVRDYKRFVTTRQRWKPASVNQALAALDSFFRTQPAGGHTVRREVLAAVAPKSLAPDEQRRFLRAVERCPSPRDRAIAAVFIYAGLRLSELAALEVDDVAVTARRGRVTVRNGKGDDTRQVPLNSAAREALGEWLRARAVLVGDLDDPPSGLWLSRTRSSMTGRAIDLVLRRLAADASVEVSAHVLRHTCVTNLVRAGTDVVLVAEIAGHRRLDTTRRYSLPSEADRDAAVEAVLDVS